MKRNIVLFFILPMFLLSCIKKNEKNTYWKDIDLCKELGFIKTNTVKKNYLVSNYSFKYVYCSNTIHLYSDSTFERESGCESNSNRAFGTWNINNGYLTMKELPFNKLNLLYDYSVSGDTSKYLIISVLNRFDKPLNGFSFRVFEAIKSYNLSTIEKGVLKIKKELFDSISINAFEQVTSKIFTIKKENFPDSLLLKIYTDADEFYGNPKYLSNKNAYYYKINGNKLIGDDNFIFIKKE